MGARASLSLWTRVRIPFSLKLMATWLLWKLCVVFRLLLLALGNGIEKQAEWVTRTKCERHKIYYSTCRLAFPGASKIIWWYFGSSLFCVRNDDSEVWISGDSVRLQQQINFHIPQFFDRTKTAVIRCLWAATRSQEVLPQAEYRWKKLLDLTTNTLKKKKIKNGKFCNSKDVLWISIERTKDKWQAHRCDGDRRFNIYTYNSQY